VTISVIISLVASLLVGGGLGAAAMVGLINSQTSAPSESPGSISQPVIDYGSVN
jgi:hypothetical protein